MPIFGDRTYSVDRDATLAAYRAAEHGGAEACDCAGCRNFVLARTKVFPRSFLDFLDRLGIDPLKDGEVYHITRVSPGMHRYGGWFHFVGTLEDSGDSRLIRFGEGFGVWMCTASAPPLPTLAGLPNVQLEFDTEAVPWLLPEPEID